MECKQIVFTKKDTAELIKVERVQPGEHEVVVKTEFSTVSCGTERANITGDLNVNGAAPASEVAVFPRYSGYSSAGIVVETGSKVESVKVGDRVVVYWAFHKEYNTVNENNVVKIEDDNISFKEAAVSFIATFPMAAVRKVKVEIGESMLVMGLGILGQIAVKLGRAAGAVPVIAADPVEKRRQEALAAGADYALDPLAEGFAEEVKRLTNGGVNTAIEVTGVGAGFDGALDCMAKYGRIALLGCTRDKNFTIDYYRKIHFPGISVIGAHTNARPDTESHYGYYTHRDDIKAVLRLCSAGRISLEEMVKEQYSPNECTDVYTRLVNDREFPTVVQFDWTRL